MNLNICNSFIIILIAFAFRDTHAQDFPTEKATDAGTWNTRQWFTNRPLYIQFFVASSKRFTTDRSDDVLVIKLNQGVDDCLSLVLNLTSNESDPTEESNSSSVSSCTLKVVRNLRNDFVRVGWNEIILSFPDDTQLIVQDKNNKTIKEIPLRSKPSELNVKVKGLFSSIEYDSFSKNDNYQSHDVNSTNVDIPVEFDDNFASITIVNEEWFEGAVASDGHLEMFCPSTISNRLLNSCGRRNSGKGSFSRNVSLPFKEKWNLIRNGFVATFIQFHCLRGCPFTVQTRILKSNLTLEKYFDSTTEETEEAELYMDDDNSDTVSIIVIVFLSVSWIATVTVLLIFKENLESKLLSKDKKVEPNVTYEQRNNGVIVGSDVTNHLSRISEVQEPPQPAEDTYYEICNTEYIPFENKTRET